MANLMAAGITFEDITSETGAFLASALVVGVAALALALKLGPKILRKVLGLVRG